MKLYQALTQVTINSSMVDDAPSFTIKTFLNQPLHFTPSELYHYIDSVLKPGSRHDQNNLKYVADAAFITENYNFKLFAAKNQMYTFEAKMEAARDLVTDLNRHVSVNLDLSKQEYQLLFVD
ncbi:hypothetical protein [Lacticaseibacillus hulanensis]|jgi:hypothetical protein|uniref:hypothetical protein n=1 Tax=Lacticaseibacillus hulanensis TaxID=2493111 RepID=UPI000FDC4718|nr:hypothetical protein [Lacticaseibacillus hulanensis]